MPEMREVHGRLSDEYDVESAVQSGGIEDSDCIVCGSCADVCPSSVIRYRVSRGSGTPTIT